jgi:hydrogenase maturation protease
MTNARDVLVLGLGNVLCSDDGAGVAVIHRLLEEYDVPDGARVLDGGTLGMALLGVVAEANDLVLVDAVQAPAAPGTLLRIEGDDVPATVAERLSVHQVGVMDLLAAARFSETYPERVVVLGVVPSSVELGLERTAAVEAALPELVERVVEELRARGLSPTKKPSRLERNRDRAVRVLGL